MSATNTSRDRLLARLEKGLGLTFNNRDLLEQALTHKSFSRQHNERLEFLGDAVLGWVIADRLYRDHPELAEDALTLLRADLVRKESLAEIAAGIGLGEFLNLGSGERKSGGRKRASILADALEAVIGAVSLDAGLDAARALVQRLFDEPLRRAGTGSVSKDPKTRLQEHLQAAGFSLPEYSVTEATGQEHARTFVVSCRVSGFNQETSGSGASRREAEKEAAQAMLDRLTESGEHEGTLRRT